MSFRIGHGFDVHKFGGDKPLILAGVSIPGAQGVLAHSDGDVVLHALCDALLGAAGLGDIGEHFPDTDERWRGADSRALLAHVMTLIAEQGWAVANVDITVVAQTPRLSGHKSAMRRQVAEDLALPESAVNLKATTTEGLGYIGRKEGIAVHAVALLMAKAVASR
ncbi:2-C-methyl-D-erythritol 2,4-cyclodiphosphate synthase [Permianibacter aggregans]|uniref:2-C-methyl-D-erythritol 2,4-cyclodiphosphate synthase n=1 Tax=Permianibacter aggregans TaxID=1510150 RepID=A0A4R6UTP1_9GAMM|nr:2-C-methyl-D-erythritol 2,4-cyclodiphosphate synthase [Permianibacter aggregans]QGX38814.1 2-C-methyl-D-erythritol 2,4-cyclodiphosphate synthase [Permianibacter aggregans]TDQ50620.1 2-C-methyl-D-erythritol 2,4-cyclodiphosphate synthase [Permianibacter aggregans]